MCVSLGKSESGVLIQAHSDHGASKEPTNPYHDLTDLGSKIRIRIFPKKRTLSHRHYSKHLLASFFFRFKRNSAKMLCRVEQMLGPIVNA